MIEEAYVSFEVAKLLKEKGFDEPVQHFYKFDSKELYRGTVFTNTQIGDKFYNAPTHQMAMKWLREDKYIFIEIKKSSNTFLYGASIMKDCSRHYPRILNGYNTYEELVEAALKYCLENLI